MSKMERTSKKVFNLYKKGDAITIIKINSLLLLTK